MTFLNTITFVPAVRQFFSLSHISHLQPWDFELISDFGSSITDNRSDSKNRRRLRRSPTERPQFLSWVNDDIHYNRIPVPIGQNMRSESSDGPFNRKVPSSNSRCPRASPPPISRTHSPQLPARPRVTPRPQQAARSCIPCPPFAALACSVQNYLLGFCSSSSLHLQF